MNSFLKPYYIFRSILVYGSFLTLLCSACVQSESVSISTPSFADQGTLTKIPTKDLIPNQQQTNSDQEEPLTTLVPTSESEENSSLVENCVEIVDTSQPLIPFPGVLAIQDGLLDLNSYQLQPFRQKILFGELVSPDGRKIAVRFDDSNDLMIMNKVGRVLEDIRVQSLIPIYWAGNSMLVLQEEINDYPLHHPIPSYILDLETGDVSQVPIDLDIIQPTRNGLGSTWGPSQFTKLAISPDREHVIFASIRNSHYAMVLWDLQSNQEILPILSSSDQTRPSWNNAGTSFVVSLPAEYENNPDLIISKIGYEIFEISTDGSMKKISAMTESEPSLQYDFVWSPNDKYISFRLEYLSELQAGSIGLIKARLAFLNVETGNVEDFCILTYAPPVWSPSGNFVAIRTYDEENKIYIVDIKEHKAYLVYNSPDDVKILGWMVE